MNPLQTHQIKAALDRCDFQTEFWFHGLTCRIKADNPLVLDLLREYYSGLTCDSEPVTALTIHLVDHPIDTSENDWAPVQRTKVSTLGPKEATLDTAEGRWIHKVRTGMVMLQSLTTPAVFGDLKSHLSQVINFINNQFLNHHQRLGFLLGHASAFSINGATTAIAASSGGGKSTLMLRALEVAGAQFLSNDRILFKPEGQQISVLGVAKHPRVNPGTLIHSDRLSSLLPETEQAQFRALPAHELWHIEQKYDVPIDQMYGPGKVALNGDLRHLVLLNWSLESTDSTRLEAVDLTRAPNVLDGLRKSPGPFFQNANGAFPGELTPPASVYIDHLPGVEVWQLTGTVDFDRAIACFAEEGLI